MEGYDKNQKQMTLPSHLVWHVQICWQLPVERAQMAGV